jgi:D-tagatose-1,6-bisphosphate aldolase subunit GatZ/KbaZ
MKINYLDEILNAQKRGEALGLPSICSAHPWVLKAAMSRAGTGTTSSRAGTGTTSPKTLKVPGVVPEGEAFRVLLIESTCNQVNQFGGYTGMTPAAFVDYVHGLAIENGFPSERLMLGGDHLGPGPWQKEPAESAMEKAADMLRAYVQAGYTKLHLDASMRLGDDDPSRPLEVQASARRTAWLARVAEETLAKVSKPSQGLRYVIGSEVPIPGGATAHEDSLHVTQVADARRTLELTQAAFAAEGLEASWERVIALVVQPGVEFGDDFVLEYEPAAGRTLAQLAESSVCVYEAHSTDYQTGQALHSLVRDHFAILKVGPGLTFAFREAVFALADIENELLLPDQQSRLVEALEGAMLRNPANWQGYYHGTPQDQALSRKYSLSDRCRYYWGDAPVQSALTRLLKNLGERPLPRTLLSQFLPLQLERVLTGQIDNSPQALILDKIRSVLEVYAEACG